MLREMTGSAQRLRPSIADLALLFLEDGLESVHCQHVRISLWWDMPSFCHYLSPFHSATLSFKAKYRIDSQSIRPLLCFDFRVPLASTVTWQCFLESWGTKRITPSRLQQMDLDSRGSLIFVPFVPLLPTLS